MGIKRGGILNKKFQIIYILVEVYKREFYSRLKIKNELESKGFFVVIGHKDTILDGIYLGILPTGIILDKCAQITKYKKWESIDKKKNIYTLLDEEGIHTWEKEVEHRMGIPRKIDFIFFNNMYHFLLSRRVYKKNMMTLPNYLISGNPRISYKGNSKIEKKGLKKVLIVANYHSELNKYGNEVHPFKRHDTKCMNLILDFIETYKKEKMYNYYELIYKPHPSEKKTQTDKFKNDFVTIVKNESINELISRSDAIVTNRCTVSIESILNNKKKIIFSFYNEYSRRIFTRAGTIRFRDKEELFSKIENYLIHKKPIPAKIIKEREKIINLFGFEIDPVKAISNKLSSFKTRIPHYNIVNIILRLYIASLIGYLMNNLLPSRAKLTYKFDRDVVKKAKKAKLIKVTLGYLYF